jgi:hypothetical protein
MDTDSDEDRQSYRRKHRQLSGRTNPKERTIHSFIEFAQAKAADREPSKESIATVKRITTLPKDEARAERFELVMETIQRHRERALKNLPSSGTKADLKNGLATFSRHLREEVVVLGALQDLIRQDGNVFRKKKLPDHIDPMTLYPSKVHLYAATEFGKYNSSKSWITTSFGEDYVPGTADPEGLHDVAIILFKGPWLSPVDKANLAMISTRFERLEKLRQMTHRLDFRALRLPNFDWQLSEEGAADQIDYQKMLLRVACWIHYDGMIEFVQRYAGWRHTGDHVRRQEMLFWLQILLEEEEFEELRHGYIDGLPYQLVSVPANNKQELGKYLKMGNSKSVYKDPDFVRKLLSKEDHREFSLLLPSICQYFTPHRWRIVLGLTAPEGKKPRIYRDCSKQADQQTSRPANSIATAETEPRITFGNSFEDFLLHLWMVRSQFPSTRLAVLGDDESSCFNQKQIHPSVVASQMVEFEGVIAFSTGNHFGGTWGPADNEPVARAKEALVQFLYGEGTHQVEQNRDVLSDLELLLPELEGPLAQAKPETAYERVRSPQGIPRIKYRMYVDDSQGMTIAQEEEVRRLVASSHEAAYILRGFPGPMKKPLLPSTIADDKQDRCVGPAKILLGKWIEADSMTVRMPTAKLERFRRLLQSHWNPKRKTFTLRAAAQLQGNLWYCLAAHGWLMPLNFYLTGALKLAMEKNAHRLRYDERFQALLREQSEDWLEPAATRQPSRMLGLRHEYTRALWRCEVKTFVPAEIHTQCRFLVELLSRALERPNENPWQRHIGHIVQRRHDFCTYDDASSGVGAGGHSPDLGFWYQLFWPELGTDFADWIRETLNQGLPTSAHINWLEYMATAVCLAGSIVTYEHRIATGELSKLGWAVLYQCNGDNKVSNTASTKGAVRTASKVARAMSWVVSSMLQISDSALQANWVDTHSNKFADSLSRKSLAEIMVEIMKLNDAPHLAPAYFDPLRQASGNTLLRNSPVRFLPSVKLLSALRGAALEPNSIGPFLFKSVNDLGHVCPDSSIFFDSS